MSDTNKLELNDMKFEDETDTESIDEEIKMLVYKKNIEKLDNNKYLEEDINIENIKLQKQFIKKKNNKLKIKNMIVLDNNTTTSRRFNPRLKPLALLNDK